MQVDAQKDAIVQKDEFLSLDSTPTMGSSTGVA